MVAAALRLFRGTVVSHPFAPVIRFPMAPELRPPQPVPLWCVVAEDYYFDPAVPDMHIKGDLTFATARALARSCNESAQVGRYRKTYVVRGACPLNYHFDI